MSKNYSEGPFPLGAIGKFFEALSSLVEERGYGHRTKVSTLSSHGEITEAAALRIDSLHAITDLREGHPEQIAFRSTSDDAPHKSVEVQLRASYRSNVLTVIADTASDLAAIVELADAHFGSNAADPAGSTSEGTGGVLLWLERHPVYRWLVVIGSIAAGIAVIWSLVLWLAHLW